MVSLVSQDHSKILASASALTSTSGLQKFYFAFPSFNFCLSGFIMNIHEEVLFITRRPSWKVLAAVWSSYSVENPLAPASEEKNSTMDAISGALKTRKGAVCITVNFC